MKVIVDPELCTGHGRCWTNAPEVYTIDDNGYNAVTGVPIDVPPEHEEAAREKFGRLDILCNNAGIDGEAAPIGDNTEENYDRVMAVNAKGVWLGMRYGVPILVDGGGGSIINTASVAAMVAFPTLTPYCASKGAVVMMTKTVAAEYAKAGIRANCICPGVTNTPLVAEMAQTSPEIIDGIKTLTPLGRIAEPIEMGKAAVFLASDDSAFITGTAIVVDGGYITL